MGFNGAQIQNFAGGDPVVRILILSHKGSSPRETGTSMLVTSNAMQGTIGGGALEQEAIAMAHKVLRTGQSQVKTFPLGPALGQCCGGSVKVLVEFFKTTPETDAPYITRRVIGLAEKPFAIERAETALRNGSAQWGLTYADGWIAEPVASSHRQVWLYGAGHVGRAIVEVLNGLPFDITWVDTAQNRFPSDAKVPTLVAVDPALAAKHAPEEAEHIVLTYSHALDLSICHQVLSQPHRSLGLIGSATKRRRFEKRLKDLGHTDAAIASMICPIGDIALGKEPKAIAIGVAAALVSAGSAADSAAIPIDNQRAL